MRILLLALLAFVTGCSGCVSLPKEPDPHSFALRLEFENGLCSATAIGPDEIISAAHCFRDGGRLNKIGSQAARGYTVTPAGEDVVRVKFAAGVHFVAWAKKFGKAVQADRVRWYGNPLGAEDMLREGYVSGVVDGMVVIAAATCVGDSGSGIFNQRGELIAIVSRIPTPKCSVFVLAVPV
ncbi:S1 family peptidase [Noviluteimonas gilva]|uniref:Trypsin-like serine protease n=1 Tax=Noviluteimonas gilva TaxID=2682097 RepID=A0A7C9HLA6_9GAMM|nr:serine protease [Lysobacter gilvus]MUV13575.1 hypothetical protein [Lysobacter gilvus]